MCPRFLPFAAAATLALAGCSSDRATAVPDGLQVRVTSRALEGTPPPPTITARGDSVVVEAYLFISSCYRTDFAAGRVSKTVVVTVTSHVTGLPCPLFVAGAMYTIVARPVPAGTFDVQAEERTLDTKGKLVSRNGLARATVTLP